MKEIVVNASKQYSVTIGSGVLSQVVKITAAVTNARRICIVSDSNVWPIYGNAVKTGLASAGYSVCYYVFSAGENSKNSTTYLDLLSFLSENELTRADCIVALGGGVVGDLAGFAAATYLRGIPYIQVPTTLLAMVDSSVGGKTAINLPVGKNLCGAFYQPSAVLCDTNTLSTLPKEVFRDGCAEVIKYAVLFDPELFALLEKDGLAFDRESVITRCVQHKRDVVAQDEFDRGRRMLLNLGHTIGHAIETYSNFAVSHGCAVAIGMAVTARAVKCTDCQRMVALIKQFGFPTTTDIPSDALYCAMLADKKRSSSSINLIIPKAIGHCTIMPTPVDELKTFIEEGM